eukprot:3699454-Alexandrium_andersonii.AAC.1
MQQGLRNKCMVARSIAIGNGASGLSCAQSLLHHAAQEGAPAASRRAGGAGGGGGHAAGDARAGGGYRQRDRPLLQHEPFGARVF